MPFPVLLVQPQHQPHPSQHRRHVSRIFISTTTLVGVIWIFFLSQLARCSSKRHPGEPTAQPPFAARWSALPLGLVPSSERHHVTTSFGLHSNTSTTSINYDFLARTVGSIALQCYRQANSTLPCRQLQGQAQGGLQDQVSTATGSGAVRMHCATMRFRFQDQVCATMRSRIRCRARPQVFGSQQRENAATGRRSKSCQGEVQGAPA